VIRRIGILASHPIQYHAPLFRLLALCQDVKIRVYFCHNPGPRQQGIGFGVPFEWDLELTSGYAHEWLRNCAPKPSLTFFGGCNTPDLPGIIRREQFDAFIVHGWNNLSCWQAFRGCRQTGTPLLVRGDSQLGAQQSPFRRKLKDLCYPTFIRKFDVCIATGSRSAEYFEHFGAKRIIISPHIVDNSWFSERAEKARANRKALRSKWGLAEDAFVFLFAGKFEPKKRPMDLIHSFARIESLRSQKAALLMVGDGILRPECEALARSNNLPLRFAGFLNQTEMPQAYAAADCLVLCSDGRETWGLVVNEAMACGLPAIVSDQCGCAPDLIVEGKTGFTYPCGDVPALARLMSWLAQNPDQVHVFGQNAFGHIQNFSPERAAEIIVDCVRQVARH